MKLVLITLLVTSTLADKLENTYLPPRNAESAGASDFLTAPSTNGNRVTGFRSRTFPTGDTVSNFPSLNRFKTFNRPDTKTSATFRSDSFQGPHIPILRMSNDNNGEGSYRFAYETDNRIVHEEEGHLENVGTNNEANVVRGAYSFQAPDGQVFTINYIADENGFRPLGDHIPTSPPIPEAIQRSLDFNRAAEESYEGHKDTPRTGFDFRRNGQKSSDVSGAASGNSEEYDDLNGVEVGRPEVGRPEFDVNRQYLTPNPTSQGYRY